MTLQQEIDKTRSEIKTDSYPMSIGELISLYENREIDIHPEFQRFFRWTSYQKSRLIESIFLGIPIPQIFVAQRKDGVWDVVDGLQRLSTIFEFVGVLRDEDDKKLPPLVLEETRYLPSLKGKKWGSSEDDTNSLSSPQKLIIKRSKIDISIILKESDEKSKFELFQRLNTGGSPLSDQEVRNSILVMIDSSFYRWMRELSQHEGFRDCVLLTDRAIEEQYDMDLVLRFLIFRTMSLAKVRQVGDINQFLTDQMIELVTDKRINLEEERFAFQKTFSFLNEVIGSDSFRKYDSSKDKFVGGFLISAFELVALGVGYNINNIVRKPINVVNITKELWMKKEFTSKSGSGIRASSRIPNTLSLGRNAFKP